MYLKFQFNCVLFSFSLVFSSLLRADSCFAWEKPWLQFLRQDIAFGPQGLEGNFKWGHPGSGVAIGSSLMMGCRPAAGRVLGSPGKAREDEGDEEGAGKVAPVEG